MAIYLLTQMPSRGPAIDPFLLREQSQRISSSISIPIGWLTVVRKHSAMEGVSFSQWVLDAIEAHAKNTGLELPKVQR